MAEALNPGLSAAEVQQLISQAISGLGVVTQAQVNSTISSAIGGLSIPAPATSMPPGVSDSGATGTGVAYARDNHTHASKARKSRKTGVNTATYTWTYDSPFTAGVVPIVTAIVEDPANSATDSYNVQIVGVPSATSCQFRIVRQSSGLLGLLLGALSLNPTPGNVNLHCIALEP